MKPSPFSRLSRLVAWAILAASVGVPAPALAGNFSVTPVRIYMSVRDRAVAVTITNLGDEQIVLQADINTWSQKPDGTDVLVLTDDLILSPPIIKLAPKARQVVRLARLSPPDLSRQQTYRFILREIPEANKRNDGIQVSIALALSMPIFITPPGVARDVSCAMSGVEGKNLGIRCENTGNAYSQIREIEILQGERSVAKYKGGAYILPGASRTLPAEAAGAIPSGAARAVVTFDDSKTEEFSLSLP